MVGTPKTRAVSDYSHVLPFGSVGGISVWGGCSVELFGAGVSMNEKLTLYILLTQRAVLCDWKPLKGEPNKKKYRRFELSHPDVQFQLAKQYGVRLNRGRVHYAVLQALTAAGLSVRSLIDTKGQ
jgi:hypothetical protein